MTTTETQAAKRPRLEQEGTNGSSSTGPSDAGATVSSPRRAARPVVDTDAELLDSTVESDEPVVSAEMAAENAKCDTP